MTHGKRIVLVLVALVVYFVVFGYLLGWSRLRDDWWPLDRSIDGPNLYVSFVWVPLAGVIAWAWSDLRHEAHKAELEAIHDRHLEAISTAVDKKLEAHGIRMERLVAGQTALQDATPGDRSIPTVEASP